MHRVVEGLLRFLLHRTEGTVTLKARLDNRDLADIRLEDMEIFIDLHDPPRVLEFGAGGVIIWAHLLKFLKRMGFTIHVKFGPIHLTL